MFKRQFVTGNIAKSDSVRVLSAPRKSDPKRTITVLRRMIWLYFWLLIFEGALRKWGVPSLSGPLLVLRDPLVVLIYVQALRCRRFPINAPMLASFVIMIAFGLLGTLQVMTDIGGGPLVVAYGLRTNFLHLPFIFIIPRVFSYADAVKVGKWILLVSIPMAVLMVLQFLSPANSWINAATIEGGHQIRSTMDKIRPAGTFSYITGPIHYFQLATAFLIFGLADRKRVYPHWLLIAALASLLAVQPVSGSRALVLGCALVLVAGIAFGMMNPARAHVFMYIVLLIGVLALTLSAFGFFREGVTVFTARWDEASSSEGGVQNGIVWRFFGAFLEPITLLPQAGLVGRGIGLGTNVGAQLTTGSVQFLLAEGEWARVVLEAGPVLGFLFLGYRLWLAGIVALRAFFAAQRQQLLPCLLAIGASVSLVTGTISQPTNLGFMVFASGLCLAAVQQNPIRNSFANAPVRSEMRRLDLPRT